MFSVPIKFSSPQPKFPYFPFFPSTIPLPSRFLPVLASLFWMEHPPGLHYLLSEEKGSGGGLWRRVLHRPITARLDRRTAHVYRQHSAGRGSARSEPFSDWMSQLPEMESHNGLAFSDFQRFRRVGDVCVEAKWNNSTYSLRFCYAQAVISHTRRNFVKSCTNVISVPARGCCSVFSRRPASSQGAVGKTNRSNGGRLVAGWMLLSGKWLVFVFVFLVGC